MISFARPFSVGFPQGKIYKSCLFSIQFLNHKNIWTAFIWILFGLEANATIELDRGLIGSQNLAIDRFMEKGENQNSSDRYRYRRGREIEILNQVDNINLETKLTNIINDHTTYSVNIFASVLFLA